MFGKFYSLWHFAYLKIAEGAATWNVGIMEYWVQGNINTVRIEEFRS
jgi:hypothetical protein